MAEVIVECNPIFSAERSDGIKSILNLINGAEVTRARCNFVNKPELIADAENRRDHGISRANKRSRPSHSKVNRIRRREGRNIENLQTIHSAAKSILSDTSESAWLLAAEHDINDEELVYFDGLGPFFDVKRANRQLVRYRQLVPGVGLLIYHAGDELWNSANNPNKVLPRYAGVLVSRPMVHLSEHTPSPTPLIDIEFHRQEAFSTSIRQNMAIGSQEVDALFNLWADQHRKAAEARGTFTGAELMAMKLFSDARAEPEARPLAS